MLKVANSNLLCSNEIVKILGLDLIQIRRSRNKSILMRNEIARAWIAIGDIAIGGFIAIGRISIAPFAIGGLSLGLSLGFVSLGATSVGLWALGGVAAGYWAIGGFAIASDVALGGTAWSQFIAIGIQAMGPEANSSIAIENLSGYKNIQPGDAFHLRLVYLSLVPAVLATLIGLRLTFFRPNK